MTLLGLNADTPTRTAARPPTTPKGAPKRQVGAAGMGIVPWAALGDQVDLFETVPELRWPQCIFTYYKMRTDAQISSLWNGTTLPIRRYDWRIEPNGARDEVVERCSTDLGLRVNGVDDTAPRSRQEEAFNHDDHLRQSLLALLFGHMFFEQFGDVVEDSESNYLWQLGGLSPILQATISEIDVTDQGQLNHVKQWSRSGPQGQTPPIPRSQLVAYVWEREGGNWIGRSWLRPLYKHWLIKDRLLRVDAMKHERNGMGIPWIEGAPGMTEPQIQELNKLAQAYKAGEASGGALPNGASLHLQGVQGAIPDTLASIIYQDQQMAQAFMAIVKELGNTSNGSRALGQTLQDQWVSGQQAIASWYADTTTRDVLWDIVDWNYGPDENAPRIVFHPHEDRNLAVKELSEMVNAGVITVDNDTEDFIRGEWNLPARNHDQPGRESTRIAPIPGGDTSEPSDTELTDTKVGVEEGAIHIAPQKVTGRRVAAQRRVKATAAVRPAPVARQSGWFRRNRIRAAAVDTNSGTGQTANQSDWVGHRKPTQVEASATTDFAAMQATWETNVRSLVTAFQLAQAEQVDDLLRQIEAAVDAGDLEALGTITTSPTGADVIASHLIEQARAGIAQARNEASAQGVSIPLPDADTLATTLRTRAGTVAQVLTNSLTNALSSKALGITGDASTGADVSSKVASYFSGLSDSYLTDMLGGALTSAQNTGRITAFAATNAPVTYYASEILDARTCDPCSGVDGTDYASLEEAQQDYSTGGYNECAGGPRCRGTIISVFQEASSGAEDVGS